MACGGCKPVAYPAWHPTRTGGLTGTFFYSGCTSCCSGASSGNRCFGCYCGCFQDPTGGTCSGIGQSGVLLPTQMTIDITYCDTTAASGSACLTWTSNPVSGCAGGWKSSIVFYTTLAGFICGEWVVCCASGNNPALNCNMVKLQADFIGISGSAVSVSGASYAEFQAQNYSGCPSFFYAGSGAVTNQGFPASVIGGFIVSGWVNNCVSG